MFCLVLPFYPLILREVGTNAKFDSRSGSRLTPYSMLSFSSIEGLIGGLLQQITYFTDRFFRANLGYGIQSSVPESQVCSSDAKAVKPLLVKSKGWRHESAAKGSKAASASSESLELVRYNPPSSMEVLSVGSTATVTRIKPGVVLKSPHFSRWHSKSAESHRLVRDIKHYFCVEEKILAELGEHPRIIR